MAKAAFVLFYIDKEKREIFFENKEKISLTFFLLYLRINLLV